MRRARTSKDLIMLRLIPTADHTLEDVERTIKAFSEIKKKVDAGKYSKEIQTQVVL